ncbi:hypothetical protein PNOK_0810500 [Pyrrhoderma noxium]|uniref:GPI ethanolamine phosphate transferase 1 n=1 Tax=Pyrrhoderma noxium TaxID=2282107 RepID=A0A286UA96_9AGAM|nr:hypothetical protein PNOK_0810500 [Pyrrhoderma noxium]
MRHFNTGAASAKRLVLIVGDGLRADLLFNLNPFPSVPDSSEIVAPYLRNVIEKRGAYGISHTRVPTESRPGHVAIIGGMYEDVSAVTKGWKTNPVDFDSVFNQSHHTYSFGSPDILPMFARGAVPGRVEAWSYNEEDEDFTKDATELDVWVYDRLNELLRNASTDATLDAELRGEKTIFFLHLLGLDTTGHSYRPHSKEYMRNIQVVDGIVKDTEELLRNFFQDDETAFVFTADHGMSNIGNHGDGNPDSTRTPLIMWGAGVRGPLPDSVPSSHNDYSAPWGLNHIFRRDVSQADIAPLMCALLGLDLPANSAGVLPEVDTSKAGYLDPKEGEEGKANAVVANAKSILEHYRVKHRLKRSHKVFFVPFPGLGTLGPEGEPGANHILRLEHLVNLGKWTEARKEAAELIQTSLEGLRYLETYDRVLLRVIVIFGYVGWSLYSATSLLLRPAQRFSAQTSSKIHITINAFFLLIFTAFCLLFLIQKEPWTYYIYIAFPCVFWRNVTLQLSDWKTGVNGERSLTIPHQKLVKTGTLVLVSLQAMVLAYRHRSIWSAGFVIIGLLWPTFFWPKTLTKADSAKSSILGLRSQWATACLICAIFPLRDVEQREDIRFIILGGLALLVFGGLAVVRLGNQQSRTVHYLQLFLILSSILVSSDSVRRLSAKEGLPLINQLSGWTILALSSISPFLLTFSSSSSSSTNKNTNTNTFRSYPRAVRQLTLFLAFAPVFVLLAICAEGLFYLAYCMVLVLWVRVETGIRVGVGRVSSSGKVNKGIKSKESTKGKQDEDGSKEKGKEKGRFGVGVEYIPQAEDVRTVMFFLFFVQVAFFGVGNVASVSSFYLEPVYRLVPIFSPFIMSSLLLYKILAPYVMLSATFATLNYELGLPPFALFLIALSLTDGMTIPFYLSVTDTGSWLEIGQSISFFVIASLLLVWSAGVCALGTWLMG